MFKSCFKNKGSDTNVKCIFLRLWKPLGKVYFTCIYFSQHNKPNVRALVQSNIKYFYGYVIHHCSHFHTLFRGFSSLSLYIHSQKCEFHSGITIIMEGTEVNIRSSLFKEPCSFCCNTLNKYYITYISFYLHVWRSTTLVHVLHST